MSRMQLALNVSDLDKAIRFYSTLFEPQTSGSGEHQSVEVHHPASR